MHSATQSIPWEDVTGRKFDHSLLQIFGADCFVHIPESRRGKLDDRARHGLWFGVDTSSMSHKVFLPDTKRLVSSIHLTIATRPRAGAAPVDSLE
ncbi:MAG: hypothetical protein ACK56I_19220, partial [bacterium]